MTVTPSASYASPKTRLTVSTSLIASSLDSARDSADSPSVLDKLIPTSSFGLRHEYPRPGGRSKSGEALIDLTSFAAFPCALASPNLEAVHALPTGDVPVASIVDVHHVGHGPEVASLADGLVFGAPLVAELLAFLRDTSLGLAERVSIFGFELVAQLLRVVERVGVGGLDLVLVFSLPALAAFLGCSCGAVFGFSDRAVILGVPPLPSRVGVSGESLGGLLCRTLDLGLAGDPFVLGAGPLLRSFALGPFPGFCRGAFVFGLPPLTQFQGFPISALENFSRGAFVFGLPPLTQFYGFPTSPCLGVAQYTVLFGNPTLTELSKLPGATFLSVA
jgi:hypothetical protein